MLPLPLSVQDVFVTEYTVAGTLLAIASLSRPYKRNFALAIMLIVEMSNFKYVSQLLTAVETCVCSSVAVPKFVVADEPSRTYTSAAGDRPVCHTTFIFTALKGPVVLPLSVATAVKLCAPAGALDHTML